jgi:hypothetical protein
MSVGWRPAGDFPSGIPHPVARACIRVSATSAFGEVPTNALDVEGNEVHGVRELVLPIGAQLFVRQASSLSPLAVCQPAAPVGTRGRDVHTV